MPTPCRPPLRRLAPLLVALLTLAATAGCSDDDGDAGNGSADGEPTTTVEDGADGAGDGDDGADEAIAPTGDPADCPAGFDDDAPLAAGRHDGFSSGDQDRSFHLLLPEGDATEPRPLFVAVTGTVQEEVAFLEQSEIDQMPEAGWIVVAPVRNDNGLVWGPWDAMRIPGNDQPNPDTTLILDLVACISAHQAVDADRVFIGGISIGGTMVNYVLQRHSDVFAGGIAESGNFILTSPDDPQPLEPMTVIVAWGGPDDQWTGCPDGRMGEQYASEPGCVTADFVADAGAASRFYADQPDVRLMACAEATGHIWISHATSWWAEVLAASPKGTTDELDPTGAPPPMECSTAPPAAP